MALIIQQSILCEIQISGTIVAGQRIPFSENQKISSTDFEKKYLVYGMFVYNRTQVAMSPTNRSVLSSNTGLAVTLMTGNTEKIYMSPVNQFSTFLNGGMYYGFNPFTINYPQCFLTVLDATTTISGESFVFSLLYKKK